MFIEKKLHYGKLFLQFPQLRLFLKKNNLSLRDLSSNLNITKLSKERIKKGFAIKKKRDIIKLKIYIKNT